MFTHSLPLGRLILRLIAVVIAVAVPEATEQTVPNLTVWVASGWERIGLADAPGPNASAALVSARAEYEPFQVVVQAPPSGLTGVSVSISDLTTDDGRVIASSNATLYREHYVYVDRGSPNAKGSNQPLGPGWYPDALIPFLDPQTGSPPAGAAYPAAPVNVDGGKNQPFWIDIYVPREASPGDYSGTVMVTADQGSAAISCKLTVWNFELPAKPSLKSSFALWSATTNEAREQLIKHRIMPQRLGSCGANPCTGLAAFEQTLIANFGLTSTDLGFWSGADASHCNMRPPPSPLALQAAASAHAPDLNLFNYTADEIAACPNLYPMIRQWGNNLHQAGVRNLITMAPDPALYDDGSGTGRSAVDIWVVLPKTYDSAPQRIAEALAKGDEIWSYNALAQDSYSPKWLLDYDPINYRIQAGFISQSLGLTGLLYWRVDKWSSDPWAQVNNEGVFTSSNYPGEGMLVYPGPPAGVSGVVPSIRLKQLREGSEDYEYVEILKGLGQGDWALQVAKSVGPDWKNWTRDKSALEAARRQLGDKIQQLQTQRGAAARTRRGRVPAGKRSPYGTIQLPLF